MSESEWPEIIKVEPLWSDYRFQEVLIEKLSRALESQHNGFELVASLRQATVDQMTHEYEMDRVRLTANIHQLQKEIVKLKGIIAENGKTEWIPVSDGLDKWMNSVGDSETYLKISHNGQQIEQWSDNFPEKSEINLGSRSAETRLCERVWHR